MESELPLFLSLTGLLALSCVAFFAACEAAFATLAEAESLLLSKKQKKTQRRARALLSQGQPLFLAIKGGRAVASLLFVGAAVMLANNLTERADLRALWGVALALAGCSVLMFAIHEVWAGRFIVDKAQRVAQALSIPLMLYYRGVAPLVKLLNRLLSHISERFHLNTSVLNHEKIRAMVDSREETDLEEDERQMIHSIIEFGDTEVHEVMVPRTDMVCVDEQTDLHAIVNLIRENGHSRIPLFKDDVDNILGIIHVKDLLPLNVARESPDRSLREVARPAHFVPESKKLDLLLKEFQKEKHHMAIVVDEYGGTAGLVTLEDVIEEIIGDIQDEHDSEQPLVRQIEENVYLVDAKVDLHELNESLTQKLPTEGEYESLGGFILSLTGYVPAEKEVISYENYRFIVEKVDRNRIIEVKLTVDGVAVEGEQQVNSD